MAKVLVPLAEGFEEMEALSVVDMLRRAGVEVVMAGIPGSMIRGAHDVKIMADRKLDELKPQDFDALVLPGGSEGCRNLERSQKVREFVTFFHRNDKLLGAICAAPGVLGKFGVLDDRKATIFPGMERELPMPRNGRVVIDRNVITSQGPATAIDFGLALVERLAGKGKVAMLKEDLVYK